MTTLLGTRFATTRSDAETPLTQRSSSSPLWTLLVGGPTDFAALPVFELTSLVLGIAGGQRRKAIVPLASSTLEVAFVRRADDVLVTIYDATSAPQVIVRDRRVSLRTLLDGCAEALRIEGASLRDRAAQLGCLKLAERVVAAVIEPDTMVATAPTLLRGGIAEHADADVPLAFGFEASHLPTGESASEGAHREDVHALLFEGRLWAHVRGRRVGIHRGAIALAAERLVSAVAALVSADDAGRTVNVRLRSGAFLVGLRSERSGEVALTLSTDDEGVITVPALDVEAVAQPILRFVGELLRALVASDRAQARNLRVTTLREEVRRLRKAVRGRGRRGGFENDDPDRLRLSSPDPLDAAPNPERDRTAPTPAKLRFTERWRVEIDGLDAGATFLCGDRIVATTPRHTVALTRDGGELIWSMPSFGSTALMAGTTLVRIASDGQVELCDVLEGDSYATTRIGVRAGFPTHGMLAGGGAVPPVVVLTEGPGRLVAIDLRTGRPRWRFSARSAATLRLVRAGRVLLIVSAEGTVQALDVASGESVWRFADAVRFPHGACVVRESAAVLAQRGLESEVFAFDAFSGAIRWNKAVPGVPAAPLVGADARVVAVTSADRTAMMTGLDLEHGEPVFARADVGIAEGGAPMTVDRRLYVNTPQGRFTCADLDTGEVCWARRLASPVADDVPRRLEPVLRGGALFIPSASVHVLRTLDGATLGDVAGLELIPDLLRVDERGWLYVAEESGHIRAFAPAPMLSLVR